MNFRGMTEIELLNAIKSTVEKPDKIAVCQDRTHNFYLKSFSQGELLVYAEKENEKLVEIKCVEWIQTLKDLLGEFPAEQEKEAENAE